MGVTRDNKTPLTLLVPRQIRTDSISVSTTNQRKRTGDVLSLSLSLKAVGMVQPLIVVPDEKNRGTEKDTFVLVAGHRRLAAARIANMETVPCMIGAYGPNDVLAIQVTENLQRESLNPVEEAQAIGAFMDAGQDLESVASTLGRSVGWVHRRANLRSLIPQIRKIVLSSPEWGRMPLVVLEHIARLPAARQEQVFKDGGDDYVPDYCIDVERFRRVMSGTLLSLTLAPFDRTNDKLVPKAGACASCPKRSGQQPTLWDDDVDEKDRPVDRCLDRKCWDAKVLAHVEMACTEAIATHGAAILFPDCESEEDKRISERIADHTGASVGSRYDFDKAKAKTPGAVRAILSTGPMAGTAGWVKAKEGSARGERAAKRATRGAAGKGGEKGKTSPMSLAKKRAGLERRRRLHVIDAVMARLADMKAVDWMGVTCGRSPLFLLGLIDVLGVKRESASTLGARTFMDQVRASQKQKSLPSLLAKSAGASLMPRLGSAKSSDEAASRGYREAIEICKMIGVDCIGAHGLYAKALEEIPEPKSWAKAAGSKRKKKDKKPARKSTGKKAGRSKK